MLAVDLSRARLGYAARKLKERGITSVKHLQGDILEFADSKERFDLVHSFGVIHHMADPRRGLRILSRLLNPGGLLFLGLYSRIARSAVAQARDLIAARCTAATAESIREFRLEIMLAPPSSPLSMLASPASDFWTVSECRDLLFHVEEHQFTLLQIEEMFRAEGLSFLGFEVPYAPDLMRFRARYPSEADLMSLSAWHEFECQNPQIFGGTYRLWAKKALV